SNSGGCAGQEVQEQRPLVRPPEESSGDGTVKQEVQDVEVDPFPDAHSGPSRTTSVDYVPQGTMEKPPNEILQVIFALVPLVDLPQNLCLVCKLQPPAQADPIQFISWKKLYYQYLKGIDHALLILQFILKRYVASRCHNHKPSLLQDRKHNLCEREKVFPTPAMIHSLFFQPAYVRAVMAAIVLLGGGVCDVQELVGCLQMPENTMLWTNTLEMLYCMATLLYAMRENEVQISNRLHYSVFNCLHHLENSLLNDPARGKPLPPGRTEMFVIFHTGTGKTSTLIQYTRKWSKLNFLYLVFNRARARQLSKDFCSNVTCNTIHAFALEEINKNNQHSSKYKLMFDFGLLTPPEVGFVLSDPDNEFIIKGVIGTLKAFFASADESITVKHVPIRYRTYPGGNVEVSEEQIIVEEAKEIWSKMETLDPTLNMAHRVTHDGYLKFWQLQKPSLSEYDAILVDGVEDFTPAMMDIILRQKCAVILAGDPHQQIYTFRGADNTGFNVPHSHIFYLTRSFRFGSEIAYIGTTLLDVSKKVRNKTLVGNNQESDGVKGKVACLSRTNKSIFDSAVKIIERKSSAKIHFLGLLLEKKLSCLIFLVELEINNSVLKAWKGKRFTSIKEYAKEEEDKVLERYIAIVEEYQDIPQLVKRIKNALSQLGNDLLVSLCILDYILGTVHMAKGLEFDTIQIEDDFVRDPTEPISEDEWNLLYVAVTRAKKHLIMPRFLADILNDAEVNSSPSQCRRSLTLFKNKGHLVAS
uniref:F-box DNA helicase 1 n=1 Tax=Naja naja TaxID=35670 RepID=A0A8C6XJQ0_NAJNA